jgi:hypothetical protein
MHDAKVVARCIDGERKRTTNDCTTLSLLHTPQPRIAMRIMVVVSGGDYDIKECDCFVCLIVIASLW